MAKRNPNDRNARALATRKATQVVPDTFTTTDGTNRVVRLKKEPDLLFIQMTIHDIQEPEAPTYEVQVGQRTVKYPLDALVIKQTEDPVEKAALRRKWQQYQQDMTDWSMELSMRSMAAVYYEGTEPDEEMIDNDLKWHRRVKIAGWKIPEDLEEKWILYLQTSLSDKDKKDLSTLVIRRTGGVSEELIAAAEETFLDDLSPDDGAGDLEDAETDQG